MEAPDYQKEEWICQVPEDITAVPAAEVRAVQEAEAQAGPGVARVWEVPAEARVVPEAPALADHAPAVFADPAPLWDIWGIGPLRHPSQALVGGDRRAGGAAVVSCR